MVTDLSSVYTLLPHVPRGLLSLHPTMSGNPLWGLSDGGAGHRLTAVTNQLPAYLRWPMMALWVRGWEKPVAKRSTAT